MPITKQEAARQLQTREFLYVAYSHATKLPYVTCDEETFNDQAWVFSTEEGIKEFGKEKLQEKIVLMGMRFEKKDFNRLYATLYAIDVNEVVWVDGDERVGVELTSVARQADFSKLEPSKRPLFNPGLQLCGIYFMQEVRKALPPEERPNMRQQEEELIMNLRKAMYLVPMEVSEENPKKISVPYLKNKNGDMMQPAFTDVMELDRFAKGKKLKAAKVDFTKLPGLLLEQSKAIAINPFGFNLVLTREQLEKIAAIPLGQEETGNGN